MAEPIRMTRAEYQAKYGTAPAVSATPVKMTRAEYTAKYGQPPSAQPTKSLSDSIWGSLAKSIASPFLQTTKTIGSIGQAGLGLGLAGIGKLTGQERLVEQGLSTAEKASEPTDFGFFGKISPIGTTPEGETMSTLRTAQQGAGVGAELSSWLMGGGGTASAAEQIAKQNVLKALKEATKFGALTGGLGTLGISLQEQAKEDQFDLGKTAFETGVGTALGGAFGLATGGLLESPRIAQQLSEEGAPRIINSLIKPLAKDFAYGKNPGRAVAQEGIIANSLEELQQKISTVRQSTGAQLGEALKQVPTQSISLEDTLVYLDKAASEAVKMNDNSLLNRINSVKMAITDELQNVDGKIVSSGKRDLSNVPLSEVPNLKKLIGEMTRWTTNRTEDELTNKALKQTYGAVKEKMMNAVRESSPALADRIEYLSSHYADLITAENATKYRDIINQRQNLIGLSAKEAGLAGAVITAIVTGGASIPSVVVGLSVAGLDKLLASPAAKTRFAKALQTLADQKGMNAVELLASKVPQLKKFIKDWIKDPKMGLMIEDVSGKAQGGIPNLSDDLLSQAKKFKSAEEFVRAQMKDFHGTNVRFDAFSKEKLGVSTGAKSAEKGFWFTDSQDVAKGYGEYASEKNVRDILEQIKIEERKGNWDRVNELTIKAEELSAEYADPIVIEAKLNLSNPSIYDAKGKGFLATDKKINDLIDKAIKNGNDSLIIKNLRDSVYSSDIPVTHTIVFDENKILTKSQLTKIWEEANKKK